MITAKQISSQLADQADRVAAHLLPAGKKQGREWCAGDVSGAPGESLKVCIQGNKAGIWADFASDQTGDLLDLWCASRGCDLGQAIKEAKEWLGVRDVRMETTVKKVYTKPKRRADWKPINNAAIEWLTKVRKLSLHTIVEFKVEYAKGQKLGDTVMLPFYRNGELVAVKYRSFPGKEFSQEAGCEPCLFGWQCFPPDLRVLVVTEGEFDAMALHTYGVPALSVDKGGGGGEKQGWVEAEYDNLARFDAIYLALDNDEAGKAGVAEIIRRLGPDRCYVITWPHGHKDANACLMADVPKEDILNAITSAKSCDPPELRDVSLYADEVCKIMAGGDNRGLRLPWKKAGDQLLLRPGETSVWAGRNGHGKALCLETQIPTPNGWCRFGDLRPGDQVFDERGQRCMVVAETPVWHGRPCYRLSFSDGTSIIADENHEWFTHTAKSRKSASEAKARGPRSGLNDQTHRREFPGIVTTGQIANSVHGAGFRAHLVNHSIECSGAIQCPDVELPIHPYVLGAWLGDGTSADNGLTCNDSQIVEEIVSCGYEVVKSASKYRYGILGGLCATLRTLGLRNNKHVPSVYLRGSVAQRLALLQGLMDTDGSATTYGRCEFSNKNLQIIQSVKELVVSLGAQAMIISERAMLYGKDCGPKYRVTFTPDFPAFRLKRKAERLKASVSSRAKHRFIVACDPVPSVPVKCIQVDSPSHMFLAGESMISTHNSQLIGWILLHCIEYGAAVGCVASMEFKTAKWLVRLVKQACGSADPPEPFVRAAMQHLSGKLWSFDQTSGIDYKHMLNVFRYAARRYGCELFVIDNLAKCGIPEDDYRAQHQFIQAVTNFSRDEDVHVCVIHHLKKSQHETDGVGKNDVKGSGSITDLADTVCTIWRNKAKEAEIKMAAQQKRDPKPEIIAKPDALLECHKQRNGDEEPTFALWFEKNCYQFLASPGHRARPIIDYSRAGSA